MSLGCHGTLNPPARRSRRIVVVLVVAITAMLGFSLPPSLHGLGIVAVLVLVGLDATLVGATAGLAFTRRPLDERESALRDFAYRRGFRLLGLALVLAIVLSIVGSYVSISLNAGSPGGQTFPELDNVVTGRGLVVIFELLVMLPTIVVAWTDVGRPDADGVEPWGRPYRMTLLALPAVVGVWLLLITFAPEQTVGPGTNANNSSNNGPQGSSCVHVVAGRMIGSNFGATVGMRVEACWNRTVAYVWADPSIPLPLSVVAAAHMPPGTPAEALNPSLTDLTSCTADQVDDFAYVSQTCTATIDATGTLHYTVRARVSALPGGIGGRDVSLVLVVTRDGRVLASP